jgi:hypothetical protein
VARFGAAAVPLASGEIPVEEPAAMPPARAPGSAIAETIAAALALLALAVFFAYRQWAESRARPAVLSPEDRAHFTRKDRRRWLNSLVMATMAALMLATTRIDPRANRAAARISLAMWLGVLLLAVLMLVLALFDWIANFRYARRHRRALRDEHRSILSDLVRLRRPSTPSNGKARSKSGPPPP